MNKEEIAVLRELARRKKEIAAQEENASNVKLWTAANDLHMTKPPIFIDEVCWHEMNVNGELTLLTKDPFCQSLERELRQEIYLWNHVRGNMVVKDTINCPIVVVGDNFGIFEDVDIVTTDDDSDVVSRHFNIQIKDEDDICKIKDPVVSIDWETTNKNLAKMQEIFDGILEVKLTGKQGLWFTPWDNLIRWTDIEPIMFDLLERPEYVVALLTRFVDASISMLEQYKALGLWDSNNTNVRVGSGGYGYSTALDTPGTPSLNAPTEQLWGCGNAQIFSCVSQQMHWDFSLEQEIRWLKNFGLNYYGCCEPLHMKMDILEKIPNLRKISASPWCDYKVMSERAQDKYVMSCKPTPAVFASPVFDEDFARENLKRIFNETKGTNIELILKDISTVSYRPQNLWRWNEIANEEIERFYN